jgi:hypothetical protein
MEIPIANGSIRSKISAHTNATANKTKVRSLWRVNPLKIAAIRGNHIQIAEVKTIKHSLFIRELPLQGEDSTKSGAVAAQ